MLENILTTVRTFMDNIDSALEQFKATEKELDELYGSSGSVWKSRFAEAKGLLETTRAKLRETALVQINSEFEEAHKVLRTAVSEPIPQDALNAIELIKNGHLITEFEIRSIMERYSNNYLASCTICNAVKAAEHVSDTVKEGFFVVSAKAIEAKINELYDLVVRVITRYGNGDDADGFHAAILYQGNYSNSVVDEYTAFIKRFQKQ